MTDKEEMAYLKSKSQFLEQELDKAEARCGFLEQELDKAVAKSDFFKKALDNADKNKTNSSYAPASFNSRSHGIAKALIVIAILIYSFTFIYGILLAAGVSEFIDILSFGHSDKFHPGVMFICWAIGAFQGSVLLGIAEIIKSINTTQK